MAKINIMGLGGLDEKNKNMYVLDVDSKIYILDAGVYEPLSNDFGIEHFVPKMTFLQENKDKVKGVFLSSANRQQIGALPQLVKIIPNIKIYGSKETIYSLEWFFGEQTKNWNTISLEPRHTEVDGIIIRPIILSASIPGTMGYIFKTPDGNVIYFTDYIFDTIKEYSTDLIDSLTSLSDQKNLLFMSDSLNANIKTSIAPNYRVTNHIESQFKKNNRIIASIYEDDIINIIELLVLAKKYNYEVAFTDDGFMNIVKFMLKDNEIGNISIKKINETNETDKNLLIIITGTRTNLYSKLDICIETGFNEKNLINENDVVAFLSPPQAGNEHHHQDISNKISRIDPTFISVTSSEKLNVHPSQFDLKNYLIFIKPKYFMPIKGYYKELAKAAETGKESGLSKENIILANSGEIFEILDGNLKGMTRKIKEIGNEIIESVNDSDIDLSVLEDRVSLGKDGLLTLSILINKDTKEILSNIDIQMKGVVFVKSQEQLLEKINNILKNTIEKNKKDWKLNRVESILNKEISKLLRSEIKKVPLIMVYIKEM